MAPVEVQECVQNRIRSFIVLDLETTSLPYDKPVKITEIAVVAALREHILGYGSDTAEISVPRVLSKLTVCVSPGRIISRNAAVMTREYFTSSIVIRLGVFLVSVVVVYTHAHKKVKFSLERAIKAQRGSRGIALLFL
jgi:hypothetical protein